MEIRLSGSLRKYVDYRKTIAYDAADLRTALTQLCSEYPPLTAVLFDSTGRISRVNRLFLNGEQIDPDNLDRTLGSDDSIDILTAIAGGSNPQIRPTAGTRRRSPKGQPRRPAPVITGDMLHTVLRRRANGESVEDIQPDLLIPTGKRKGHSPSLSSIYRALAEHGKTQASPEAAETAHADFAVLQQCDRSPV